MKILYISPEHTVGALSLWKAEHKRRGNECRYITWFRSASGYEEDICLDLPFISSGKIYHTIRGLMYKTHGEMGDVTEKKGYPPTWSPANFAESIFFKTRELLWTPIINRAIKKYDLYDYDYYHLEWGMEFYRDGRFAAELKKRGKKIICTYHGQDMRNRGVISAIDKLSDLNLTSELDLTFRHPNLNYLFLPYDTSKFTPRTEPNKKIVVSHATRQRWAKGSDAIIAVCEKLHDAGKIEFKLVEDRPHSEVLEVKSQSDIYIDQLFDRGGWGYGMNSVEALAFGAVCFTRINDEYRKFIPNSPFVNATPESLEDELLRVISDREELKKMMRYSREWVVQTHDVKNVADKLYSYYDQIANIKAMENE